MGLLLAVSFLAACRGLAPAQNSPVSVPAEPIQKTEPEYSDEARLAGLEGTVVRSGAITDQGLPQDMRVTKPLGLGLDEKALEAVWHWRFPPSTKNGPLVAVPVDFGYPTSNRAGT